MRAGDKGDRVTGRIDATHVIIIYRNIPNPDREVSLEAAAPHGRVVPSNDPEPSLVAEILSEAADHGRVHAAEAPVGDEGQASRGDFVVWVFDTELAACGLGGGGRLAHVCCLALTDARSQVCESKRR